MRFIVATILSALCLLCTVKHLQSARILAVVPTPSYSHQIPYRPLWKELHKRGHEVVLITSNPMENMNVPNFTQINIGPAAYKKLRAFDFIKLRFDGVSFIDFTRDSLIAMSEDFAELTLGDPEVRKMCAPGSNQTFDVVLTEALFSTSIFTLSHRFNAPLIGMSSLGLISLNEHALGGFALASHEYTWEMEANTGSNLPFWKRLKNFVTHWHYMYMLYRELLPSQQRIAEKYMGPSVPPTIELLKNTSLLFINQADILTAARPKLPNMITFSSFHVKEDPPQLPKELQAFLDGATKGFIYFSLGSNAMSSNLPKEVQQVFLDVFAKLPYRVVWKYEKELQNKTDNVYTAPWLAQQTVLAHPNIKLFIYQGGLQSSEETVHFTVPVIGFPVLADQDYQVARMEAVGIGKTLDITTVTREELIAAIQEVITNKKYKENIIKVKELVYDNPIDLVDNLVWWTEYVIRHKGTPHLRSTLASQPWYQRADMDCVVFLTIVAFIVFTNALSLASKCLVLGLKRWQLSAKKQKTS